MVAERERVREEGMGREGEREKGRESVSEKEKK